MVAQTFTLTGENIQEPVCNFVRQYYQQAHESNYPGGFIRMWEEYSFWEGNNLMVCLRVNMVDAPGGIILIEVISGGGSGGNIGFGNWVESKRIKRFRKRLEAFCKEMKIALAV